MSVDQEDYKKLLLVAEYETIWQEIKTKLPVVLQDSFFIRQYTGARYLMAKGERNKAIEAFKYLDSLEGYADFEADNENILDDLINIIILRSLNKL